MKKKLMKSTLAVALVAAAAFGGVKTYDCYVQSNDSILLSENIEAMSDGGEGRKFEVVKCYMNASEDGNEDIICSEGTNAKTVYDCPSETQKADISSASGYCLQEKK